MPTTTNRISVEIHNSEPVIATAEPLICPEGYVPVDVGCPIDDSFATRDAYVDGTRLGSSHFCIEVLSPDDLSNSARGPLRGGTHRSVSASPTTPRRSS